MLNIRKNIATYLLKVVFCSFIILQGMQVHAQVFIGNSDTVYISAGEQLYINGDLELTTGGTLTNNSTTGINLTGTATLNGVMEYIAAGNQAILPFDHHDLHISGSGYKSLMANTKIYNNLQLGGNAKLITDNYFISLNGTNSSVTAAGFGSTANSWIVTGNGNAGIGNAGTGGLKISAIGSTGRTGTITFPVGPTAISYDPLTLANTGTTDDFTVTVNDQVVPGANPGRSVRATWNISEATVGGSNVTLGTQWNMSDEALSFIRTFCSIVHSNGTAVNYYAAVGAASGSDPFIRTGNGFTVFSPFGVTSDAIVLPLHFISITARPLTAAIQVDWNVSDQSGIRYYGIQKINTNGVFENIGNVAVNNNRFSYNWLDRYPVPGINLYRIAGVDVNGNETYSGVARVDWVSAIAAISLYPNPVLNNKTSLSFTNKIAGNYFIKVFNSAGATVYQTSLLHNGGNKIYSLVLPASVAKGIYQVSITEPGERMSSIELMVQ